MAKKFAPRRPAWRRAIRAVVLAMLVVPVLSVAMFFLQPHGATHPGVTPKTTGIPAGSQVVTLTCATTNDHCTQIWYLAKQHEIATNNLAVMNRAQSPGPKLWSDIASANLIRYAAIVAVVIVLMAGAWQFFRRRPSVGSGPVSTTAGRASAAIAAILLLGLVALFPVQAETVPNAPGGAAVWLTSFGWLHHWVPSAGQKNLSVYTEDQEVYEPYADIVYRGGKNPPPRADARAFTAKVLQGQPVPTVQKQAYDAYLLQTNQETMHVGPFGAQPIMARSSLYYSVAKSVPIRTLAGSVILGRVLVPIAMVGAAIALLFWGTSRAALARRYFKAALALVVGFLLASVLLTVFSWWSVLVPMWTSAHLGSGAMAWLVNLMVMWFTTAAFLLVVRTFVKQVNKLIFKPKIKPSVSPGTDLVLVRP